MSYHQQAFHVWTKSAILIFLSNSNIEWIFAFCPSYLLQWSFQRENILIYNILHACLHTFMKCSRGDVVHGCLPPTPLFHSCVQSPQPQSSNTEEQLSAAVLIRVEKVWKERIGKGWAFLATTVVSAATHLSSPSVSQALQEIFPCSIKPDRICLELTH